MALSPAWLDELRSRISLSALIGKTVKVVRAGREHKACCPFHNEKTPSFTINDARGFYHCFGCGAHGDAIRWLTEHRGLSFMDAVKELAASAGMEVPAADPRAAETAQKTLGLRDACEAAAQHFADRLMHEEGAAARAYLAKRGLSPAIARQFQIGFAPDRRDGIAAALGQFSVEKLIDAGLLIKVDDKPAYDRFRGRLMIPIRDARGRTIAFGGRILEQGEPKYLNSPDTPLFDKGRTLFNLDRAAAAARKSGRLLVVEGYMDVIALAQAGLDEAVAPLGTALTEQQIALLWRHCATPVLCFDGDAAGQRAAMRAAERALPLLQPGFSLSIMTLPAGEDPDDVVRSGGLAAIEGMIADAKPLIDWLWERLVSTTPLATPEQRAELKKRLRGISDAIRDPDIAAHYRQMLRERHDALFFASAPGTDRAQMPVGRRSTQPLRADPRRLPPSPAARAVLKGGIANPLAQAILAGLLRHPQRILPHAENLARLRLDDDGLRAMADAMIMAVCDPARDDRPLDNETLDTILLEAGLARVMDRLRRERMLPFSFVSADRGDAQAQDDLDEAVAVALAWDEIDMAFAEATKNAALFLDEAAISRQQELALAKRAVASRIEKLRNRSG